MTNDLQKKLIAAAKNARDNAYAPCSHYKTGAAVLVEDDQIVVGCNVENSKFLPIGTCAELTALHSARAQGFKEFKMIAIVTENGGMPCGKCRETIADHNPNMPIIVSDLKENLTEATIQELMPKSFEMVDG